MTKNDKISSVEMIYLFYKVKYNFIPGWWKNEQNKDYYR